MLARTAHDAPVCLTANPRAIEVVPVHAPDVPSGLRSDSGRVTGYAVRVADGSSHINMSKNPGMASAGRGDVLTGMIAALLSQGVEPKTAILAGVFLRGTAADLAVACGAGPAGLTASETIVFARKPFDNPG